MSPPATSVHVARGSNGRASPGRWATSFQPALDVSRSTPNSDRPVQLRARTAGDTWEARRKPSRRLSAPKWRSRTFTDDARASRDGSAGRFMPSAARIPSASAATSSRLRQRVCVPARTARTLSIFTFRTVERKSTTGTMGTFATGSGVADWLGAGEPAAVPDGLLDSIAAVVGRTVCPPGGLARPTFAAGPPAKRASASNGMMATASRRKNRGVERRLTWADCAMAGSWSRVYRPAPRVPSAKRDHLRGRHSYRRPPPALRRADPDRPAPVATAGARRPGDGWRAAPGGRRDWPLGPAQRRARLLAGGPATPARPSPVRADGEREHAVRLLVSAGCGATRGAHQRNPPVGSLQLGLAGAASRLHVVARRQPAAAVPGADRVPAGRHGAVVPERAPDPRGAGRPGDPALADPVRGRRRDQVVARAGHRLPGGARPLAGRGYHRSRGGSHAGGQRGPGTRCLGPVRGGAARAGSCRRLVVPARAVLGQGRARARPGRHRRSPAAATG